MHKYHELRKGIFDQKAIRIIDYLFTTLPSPPSQNISLEFNHDVRQWMNEEYRIG
jgi:hypothetical protein